MPEPRQNNRLDLRHEGGELWKIWGAALAVVAFGLLLTWQFVGEAPPKHIVVATGVAGGGYDGSGVAIRDALADSGITVELRPTAGSEDNLELLRSRQVDVAFVQGGMIEPGQGEGLAGVASLYFEPLWIFVRSDLAARDIGGLAGQRIQVGAPGSGTRAIARRVLAENAIGDAEATLQSESPDAAIAALVSGASDALFLVSTPGSDRVLELHADPRVRPFDLERAHAYSRHFHHLESLVLTPGMIDLEDHLPAEPVRLIAPAACLIARAELHPAIHPLLIEAARSRHGRGGLFEDEGDFPSTRNLDVAAASSADRYFRNGPSFLHRFLPFQVAATINRLTILLLPLLTLILPIFRIAPPAYRWRIRRRIFRWYRDVLRIEAIVRERPTDEVRAAACEEIRVLQTEIAAIQVPPGYAEELYNLRMHLDLVRTGIERQLGQAGQEFEAGA